MENREITPFDQEYYDSAYFDTASKRMVDKNTGKETVWGYMGTDWSGNYHILESITNIFKGEFGSVLDLGCGQGSFVDYALRKQFVAKGYDFSKYAVDTALNFAKGRIFQADVTQGIREENESYDLIFSSDMLEHIKKSLVEGVIKEFYRITRRWVFLQFPVIEKDSELFDAEIHGKDHPLYVHFMIAGHLNMEKRPWWDNLFIKNGFKIRDDLVIDFRADVPRPVIANWANIVILEK